MTIYSSRDDIQLLTKINNVFKKKRDTPFKFPQKGDSVILLLSGGLDSISLWFMLMNKYKFVVYPIHIEIKNDPLKRQSQKLSIKYYSQIYKKKFPTLFREVEYVSHQWLFSFTKLKNVIIDDPLFIKNNFHFYPEFNYNLLLFLNNPSRLSVYTSYAYEYLLLLKFTQRIDITTIFLGIIAGDADLTYESTLTTLRSLNLYMCQVLNDYSIQIGAPIDSQSQFRYTKEDLLLYSNSKGLDLSYTRSCHINTLVHCGRCSSCIGRKRVFAATNIEDKTIYSSSIGIDRIPYYVKKLIYRIQKFFQFRHISQEIQLQGDNRIYITKQATWIEKDNTIYLLDRKKLIYEELNGSASYLWLLISKNSYAFTQIITMFSKKYKLSKKRARIDVQKFLAYYINNGLLKIN